ncbi:MAG: hypothetical protein PHY44_00435 [Lachnospiraceae bacterium]|nr:hypothetical protein [Lachnospiraceae bacterium]
MKSIKFSRIKNFVIVGLIFAAVYQTGTLWLGNYTGHNFFYSILNTNNGLRSSKKTSATLIDAQKIVVGYGNKYFNLIYPGLMGGKDILPKTNGFITSLLENGKYVTTEETVLEQYIGQKCVIYDFAFDVSATQYFIGMGTVNNDNIKGINSISQIIAVPAAGKNDVSYLYIVDAYTGKTNIFEANSSVESEKLYSQIEELEGLNVDSMKYISTRQSGFNIFKENTFVPQWTQSKYQYAAINKISTLSRFGDDIDTELENATSGFFDNYYTKSLTKDSNGVYMISDDNTVVKYYPQGTMEYFNYQSSANKTEQTLSTAYYACKEFLKKDGTLKTKMFLSDVKLNKSDGLVFCFDYCINDIPIFLSEKTKENLSIEHAAEVVVESNTVKKYKRYAYDFEALPSHDRWVDVDFLGAMNQAIASEGDQGSVTEIGDIVLAYYVDESSESGLKWFTYVDGEIHTVDTVKNVSNQDVAEDGK